MEKEKQLSNDVLFVDLTKASSMVSNTTYKPVRAYRAFTDNQSNRTMFVSLRKLKQSGVSDEIITKIISDA